MTIKIILVAALLVLSSPVPAQAANPIRKVVTLLQNIQKKVTEEGEKADELLEKYMCYCKTSGGDLAKNIQTLDAKTEEIGPNMKAAINQKSQLEKAVAAHQQDLAAAKKAIDEATSLREKEEAAFEKETADSKAKITAMRRAAKAIFNGVMGNFLQTPDAGVLRNMLVKSQASLEANRREVLSFLSGGAEGPASEQVLGILSEMEKDMQQDSKDMAATEQDAAETFTHLRAAKNKEVDALTKAIQEKLGRMGRLGMEIADMKNELGDSIDAVAQDKAFAADLARNCATKQAGHEQEKSIRAQEIVSLAETIKMLNDDDALALFKKTLPSAGSSFLQLQTTTATMRAQARSVLVQTRAKLQPASNGAVRLDFITLALSGRKKNGLEKIVQLVDELVNTMKEEQVADDSKKQYCIFQLDSAEDKKKALVRSKSDLETSIDETKESISTLTEEIGELTRGITALDKAVAEATEQRQTESKEFQKLMADNGAAKELLVFAKERLSQFYHTEFVQVSDSQSQNQDQVSQPTLVQEDALPPPSPESMAAYKKKDGGAVVNMITVLIGDLDKQMVEARTEEKIAQEQYEKTMQDSAQKRAQDSKSLSGRTSAKADAETQIEESAGEKKATTKELMAADSYLMSLHGECDWLMQYYDVRKEARSDEIDGLQKAKAILSGADLSFVQVGSSRARARKFLRLPSV